MLLSVDQRRLLGAFLRSHREALAPESAGRKGPQAGRRRTPGLRREEVAELCGLSTSWYTFVEQGRDVSVSAGALARLAAALRLSAAERAYLFELARLRDPVPSSPGSRVAGAPPELAAVLRATAAPAYLLDRLWQIRAWNEAAGRLFALWLDSGETCLLRFVFLDPAARDFVCDWENRARRLLAEFRADTAHDPEDPAMRALVEGLLGDASFARFWTSHAVLAREGGARTFNHPQDGVLRYEQVTLVPAGYPDHKLVMLLPEGSC